MPLGYYHSKLATHAIIVPIGILCIIMISVIQVIVNSAVTEISFLIINGTASLLSIWFLFPRMFYIMNIDMGNYRNSILWMVPLTVLTFGYNNELIPGNYLAITKIPLILFIYHHVMRMMHQLLTNQQPSFGAIWFDKGNKDKFSKRRISNGDILFNMLYAGIPILVVVCLIFYNEVNK